MALGPENVLARQAPEKIVMENREFARWLGRRKGVSAKALASAINLLAEGITEAMAEGYGVRVWRLGTFEVRVRKAHRRYHRLKKEVYVSPAREVVHFKKSENLNKRVKNLAQARIDKITSQPNVPLAVRK